MQGRGRRKPKVRFLFSQSDFVGKLSQCMQAVVFVVPVNNHTSRCFVYFFVTRISSVSLTVSSSVGGRRFANADCGNTQCHVLAAFRDGAGQKESITRTA